MHECHKISDLIKSSVLGLIHRIATPQGGLATPPGTFNGTLLKKKDHFFFSAHVLAIGFISG